MTAALTCKFWGVRGAMPAPLNGTEYRRRLLEILGEARRVWQEKPELSRSAVLETLHPDFTTLVGGETNCIEVRFGDTQLVVDLGTGARRLGYDMMVRKGGAAIHVLFTHSHWDHIQGWPFFIPGYLPSSEFHFHSVLPDLEERFESQQVEFFFPVEFQTMASVRKFHQHALWSEFDVGQFKIQVGAFGDSSGRVAYRISAGGRSLLLAPDCVVPEPSSLVPEAERFLTGVNTMVLGGEVGERGAAGTVWSGAPGRAALALASHAGATRLVLTGHEPLYIEKDLRAAHQELARTVGSMELRLAREGDEFQI